MKSYFFFLRDTLFFSYTIVSTISNYVTLLTFMFNNFLLNYKFFWKVANYADAYWFLYTSKKVFFTKRYL